MNTTIYYFSGTGNSLKISKDLSSAIDNCKIIRVAHNTLHITADEQSDRIGFIFPVYFRGLPHMMENFIKNLRINANTYFFAVANFGGYAALTFEQINEILKNKGARLNANFSVPMPGNMWFMYYPHPKKDFEDRVREEPNICLDIANKINSNFENDLPLVENPEKEQKMYNDFIPNNTDENFWTNAKCIGCSICAKVCPAENIEIINGRPLWKHQCEQCLACLHWCPNGSIEYKRDSLDRERYHNPYIDAKELFS